MNVANVAGVAALNHFMVGVRGSTLVLLNRQSLYEPLNRDRVLNLCAWLLTMVECLDVADWQPITDDELFVAKEIAKGSGIADVTAELQERTQEREAKFAATATRAEFAEAVCTAVAGGSASTTAGANAAVLDVAAWQAETARQMRRIDELATAGHELLTAIRMQVAHGRSHSFKLALAHFASEMSKGATERESGQR